MMWKCGNFEFDTRVPVVMGILNVTPDSFSDGGQHADYASAVTYAREMVEQGAQIIDVGGESTRPGSAEVTVDQELDRVLDVVRALADLGYCVSIDTRHAQVAQACVNAGASIINDVSGFRDPDMVKVAAGCNVGLVVMHMQGTPETMQEDPQYTDVVEEVKDYLVRQARMLQEQGVDPARICVDPGPGFGKTPSQTMELMRNLHEIRHLGYPVMCAVSRKSFIGWAYNIPEASDRDVASAAEALLACELGAGVVRTHNVAKTVEGLKDLRPYAVIGMGSNVALVGGPGEERAGKIANLEQAIQMMCTMPDTQIVDISSYYDSEPAYLEDQEAFVNAVVVVRTGLAPMELLKYLHAIENSLGRTRTVPNGPRTLDLDIEDYQMYHYANETLTLPHPRVCERDFVVRPLLEVLPGHILADGTPVTFDQVRFGACILPDATPSAVTSTETTSDAAR